MADTEIPQARLEEIPEDVRWLAQEAANELPWNIGIRGEALMKVLERAIMADRRARSSLMDVAVEALDKMAQPLTFAGNVAYNMKQTTSTVESSREFERINGWVDEALSIRRTALQAISASRNTGGDDVKE